MNKRSGPFWDGIEGRAPVPPAAATLGLEVIAADSERDTIELAFAAREDFTNPAGNVLGAFVAAMLYDTVGPALLATPEPDQFQSTLELNVNFLRPVRPGRVVGKGRVVHRDGDIAFIEAALIEGDSSRRPLPPLGSSRSTARKPRREAIGMTGATGTHDKRRGRLSGTSAHAQTMIRTYRDEAQERLATRTTMYREMP